MTSNDLKGRVMMRVHREEAWPSAGCQLGRRGIGGSGSNENPEGSRELCGRRWLWRVYPGTGKRWRRGLQAACSDSVFESVIS